MKKLLSMAISILMVFALVGCGEGGGTGENSGGGKSGELIPFNFSGTWSGYSYSYGEYVKPGNERYPDADTIVLEASDAALDSGSGLYKGTFTIKLSNQRNGTRTVTGNYETEPLPEDSLRGYTAQFYATGGDPDFVELLKNYDANGEFGFWVEEDGSAIRGSNGEFFTQYRLER